MELKQCPQCKRYSVSFDFNRGVEMCRWRDCNWVNVERKELQVAHRTVITNHKNDGFSGESVKAEQRILA